MDQILQLPTQPSPACWCPRELSNCGFLRCTTGFCFGTIAVPDLYWWLVGDPCSYLVVVLSFSPMTFYSTTWKPTLKIFNMFKTTLMNFVIGYHPTSCHWTQTNASHCSFQGKDSPLSRLPFIWMGQYLSMYLIDMESWFPLTSLGLAILRISAPNHVSMQVGLLYRRFYKHFTRNPENPIHCPHSSTLGIRRP